MSLQSWCLGGLGLRQIKPPTSGGPFFALTWKGKSPPSPGPFLHLPLPCASQLLAWFWVNTPPETRSIPHTGLRSISPSVQIHFSPWSPPVHVVFVWPGLGQSRPSTQAHLYPGLELTCHPNPSQFLTGVWGVSAPQCRSMWRVYMGSCFRGLQ